jgi:hypothetical protein
VWEIFQRNRTARGILEISAAELSALLKPFFSKLMILDLRRRDEVEHYPLIIPGALLTAKMDVPGLIGWLPPRTWVVLYATDDIPRSFRNLHLLRNDLNFFALSGGLRAWWRDELEMESVDLYAGGLRLRN